METERVKIDLEGHVAMVALARPAKHNALDAPMFDALIEAAGRLRSERGVRAVVLYGEGPSFSSGLDLASMMSDPAGLPGMAERLGAGVPTWFQRAAYDWTRVPVPVIAAVHGHCLGGGLQIALGADIRIAAPDARLSVMEIKWGLIPDMAITRTLPRLVGVDVAKELTFTGRVLTGAEAQSLGVVTRVSEDPLGAARALAEEIAARSPTAVRAAKRLLDEAWIGPAGVTLGLEARLQESLLGSPNQLEAVTAGMAKRPPDFTDPA